MTCSAFFLIYLLLIIYYFLLFSIITYYLLTFVCRVSPCIRGSSGSCSEEKTGLRLTETGLPLLGIKCIHHHRPAQLAFLYNPGLLPAYLGVALPIVSFPFQDQPLIKICPDLPTGQSTGGSSSIESPSSWIFLGLCQPDRNQVAQKPIVMAEVSSVPH